MVRLKGDIISFKGGDTFVFQFHNGSIKSYFIPICVNSYFKFQFHNGSIKRVQINSAKVPVYHFNSTMVRLKVQEAQSLRKELLISIPQWFD